MSNEVVSDCHRRFSHSGWFGSFFVFLLFLVCTLSVTESLPYVWDEPDAMERGWLISKWFSNPQTSGWAARYTRIYPGEVCDGYTQEQIDNAPRLYSDVPLDYLESQKLYVDPHAKVTRFSPEIIRRYWHNTTQVDGHPAGYALLIAGGKSFCSLIGLDQLLSEKVQYRFGHIFLFSIALSLVFFRVHRSFGTMTGLCAVFCIVCIPRVFAHSQIAACDSPLMSTWLIVWATFETGLKSKWKAVFWGILLGIALSMKFTAWFIPFAFMAFACCYHIYCIKRPNTKGVGLSWAMLRLFLIGFPISLFVFYLLNPTLWHDPFVGICKFFYLCIIETRNACPVSVRFFGKSVINLPWYNTLVLLGITVPVGILFFGLATPLRELYAWLVAEQKRADDARLTQVSHNETEQKLTSELPAETPMGSDSLLPRSFFILLVFINFAMLMLVRMLPNAPGHDGVRLFVAAFPFFAILAGIGLGDAIKGLFSRVNKKRSISGFLWKTVVILVIPFSAFNMYWYSPHWLAYYNFVIGGPHGAAAAGMETTYYWDCATPDVVDWVNKHTDKDKYAWFYVAPDYFDYRLLRWQYKHWPMSVDRGIVKALMEERDFSDMLKKEEIQWVIVQSRQGNIIPIDAVGFDTVKPAFEKCIRQGGIGPWDLSKTPLLRVYDVKKLDLRHYSP